MLTKLALLAAFSAATLGFPDGAPTSACRRMVPNHGPNSATLKGDDVPFELLAMPQENGQVQGENHHTLNIETAKVHRTYFHVLN